MHAALVMLRQELSLVRSHVHLHRTLRLASLAAQAKIQRLMHGLALESLRVQRPREHLPQQVRTAPRRMLLVAGGAIARTHHPAVCLAARAHAHASFRCRLQRSAVLGKRKVRVKVLLEAIRCAFFLARPCRRRLIPPQVALAQVLDRVVDAHRIDQLAGIHAVVRIPQRLELAKRLHQLGPEHLRQERRARLPIAVLAAQRSAELQHHVRRAIEKFAEIAQPFSLRKSKLMRMCTHPCP